MYDGNLYGEEFIVLADVSATSALIAWGVIFFECDDQGTPDGKPIDEDKLPERWRNSIGYDATWLGPAYVTVGRARYQAHPTKNFCLIENLTPDTPYEYAVNVAGRPWAPRPLDWSPRKKRIVDLDGAYKNQFRTHPGPRSALEQVTFGVIGDYGTGVRKDKNGNPQQTIANQLSDGVDAYRPKDALRFLLTTGDNIYARRKFGFTTNSDGDEDDDWYFTFFQPYRYVLNRIPVYPSVGNHDTEEKPEGRDDREALVDNFHLKARANRFLAPIEMTSNSLIYSVAYGSQVSLVALDTSHTSTTNKLERGFNGAHERSVDACLADAGTRPTWRIPFFHHPPFCHGPKHSPDVQVQKELIHKFKKAGVGFVLSGHEHVLQAFKSDEITYVITGAAGGKVSTGRLRSNPPTTAKRIRSAQEHHWLRVTLTALTATLEPIGLNGAPIAQGSIKIPAPPNG